MTQTLSPKTQSAQINRQKTPEEKLKFLKREEINTMQKDVSRLREAEAKETVVKISQAKNPEELKKEREKKEQVTTETQVQAVKQPTELRVPAENTAFGNEIENPEMAFKNEVADLKENKKETGLKTTDFFQAEVSQKKGGVQKENIDFLTEEKRKMERDLSWLPEQKIPLEKELKRLQDEIENIQSTELGPVLREEKKIEEEKKSIEEREKAATFQDRQTIESQRWEIERKRKETEEKKWQIENRIEEKDQKIKKIKLKISEITGKEKELATEIESTSEKAEGFKLQKDRIELEQKLNKANVAFEKLETDFQNIKNQKANSEKNFNEILTSEKALEEEIAILEEKEAKAQNLAEQKEIEQKRWETDSLRKKTETEKWQQQAKNKEIEQQYADTLAALQKLREEKTDLDKKIKEIDNFLEKTGQAAPSSPKLTELDEKNELPLRPAVVPPPPQPVFKPEQKIPVPKTESRQNPPSGLKRILIRLGVLAISITIIALPVWFFILKDRMGAAPTPTPTPSLSSTSSPTPEPTEKPEVVAPQSLIAVADTKIINVETPADLQDTFFKDALAPENSQEQFTRILIKDTSKNQYLGIKDFFEAFSIAAPEGLYDKLDNDFTLFAYSTSSNSNDSRVGFVAKIKNKDGLADLMKEWEKTMASNLNVLFSKGLERNQPPLSSVFKNAYFKKQSFRYQTFSKDDFGICYGIVNDYFVFTTSGRSMLKTIDLLLTIK